MTGTEDVGKLFDDIDTATDTLVRFLPVDFSHMQYLLLGAPGRALLPAMRKRIDQGGLLNEQLTQENGGSFPVASQQNAIRELLNVDKDKLSDVPEAKFIPTLVATYAELATYQALIEFSAKHTAARGVTQAHEKLTGLLSELQTRVDSKCAEFLEEQDRSVLGTLQTMLKERFVARYVTALNQEKIAAKASPGL